MKPLAQNKKAFFNYELIEQFEAGAILQGWEVKSIKSGGISLKESYILVRDGKVYLIGAHVPKWPGAYAPKDGETRERELLLHDHEIAKLQNGMKIKGQTITPLDAHLYRGRVKFNIALVRGKKLYDKRSKLKEKDQKREIERDLKNMGMVK